MIFSSIRIRETSTTSTEKKESSKVEVVVQEAWMTSLTCSWEEEVAVALLKRERFKSSHKLSK